MKKTVLLLGALVFMVVLVSSAYAGKVQFDTDGNVRATSEGWWTANANEPETILAHKEEAGKAFLNPGEEVPIYGQPHKEKDGLFHFVAVREYEKRIAYSPENGFVVDNVGKIQERSVRKFNPFLLLCAWAIIIMIISNMTIKKMSFAKSKLIAGLVAIFAAFAAIAAINVFATVVLIVVAIFAFQIVVAIDLVDQYGVKSYKMFSMLFYVFMATGMIIYLLS